MQNYYQAFNKTNSKAASTSQTPALSSVPSYNKGLLLNAHPYSNYSPLLVDQNILEKLASRDKNLGPEPPTQEEVLLSGSLSESKSNLMSHLSLQ